MAIQVKYIKILGSPKIFEVKAIDTSWGDDENLYMLESEEGILEPYGEAVIEKKFYSKEDADIWYETIGKDLPQSEERAVCRCGSPLDLSSPDGEQCWTCYRFRRSDMRTFFRDLCWLFQKLP
jgi:hypothetical protein